MPFTKVPQFDFPPSPMDARPLALPMTPAVSAASSKPKSFRQSEARQFVIGDVLLVSKFSLGSRPTLGPNDESVDSTSLPFGKTYRTFRTRDCSNWVKDVEHTHGGQLQTLIMPPAPPRPATPRRRAPAAMETPEDGNGVVLCDVKEGVRKSPKKDSSHFLMNWRIGFWIGRYEFD
jgi:hypothetical protein